MASHHIYRFLSFLLLLPTLSGISIDFSAFNLNSLFHDAIADENSDQVICKSYLHAFDMIEACYLRWMRCVCKVR